MTTHVFLLIQASPCGLSHGLVGDSSQHGGLRQVRSHARQLRAAGQLC